MQHTAIQQHTETHDHASALRIAVIGAGQMGRGIAHSCAQHGHTVSLYDKDAGCLERAMASIEIQLKRQADKSIIVAESIAVITQRITAIHSIAELTHSPSPDMVIEAIVENLAAKQAVLSEVESSVSTSCIIASNTSSISITELGQALRHSERSIGIHFMNPVALMKLVEIIPGADTLPAVVDCALTLARGLHKTPVVSRDYPGFIANRILMPMINEAAYTCYEGIACVEDIDTTMKLGMHHPTGPLTLADYIGIDTCVAIMQVLHQGLELDKYAPCPLLVQMVRAKWFGRKSGTGFYHYQDGAPQVNTRLSAFLAQG